MSKEKGTGTLTTMLKQDKVCKSCIRFSGDAKPGENDVTTAIYLLNSGFETLGKPDEIEVTVKAK